MSDARPPDHGNFVMKSTLNDDLKVIRSAMEMAKKNTSKPGHYWQRAVVRVTTPQGPVELIRMYHVDLNAGVVEITETYQEKETARRTVPLDDMG